MTTLTIMSEIFTSASNFCESCNSRNFADHINNKKGVGKRYDILFFIFEIKRVNKKYFFLREFNFTNERLIHDILLKVSVQKFLI